MKITFLHELDTGFMAFTLKPAFERLGHECIVMQGFNSHLESDTSRIDYLLKDMSQEQRPEIERHFKDTDLFILRAGDDLIHGTGILPYLNKNNTLYRLHGFDLTGLNRPYALRAWRVTWHKKEPQVVTYPDPTFLQYLRTTPIYIERPIDLSIIPRRNRAAEPFVLCSPSGFHRKGADDLTSVWNSKTRLQILSHLGRDEVLKTKAQAHYLIDNISPYYDGGPYGMNAVEAWLLRVPVFSRYSPVHEAICPELSKLVHNVTLETVQETIEQYEPDTKQLSYAYKYAKRVHDSDVVAKQYIALGKHINEGGVLSVEKERK